jgi:putative transposase
MPHSQTCDTFRASDASAFGTGLGRQSFADDFERNAVPQGFVAELLPEHRPTGIEDGFCHPRLRQSGRVHITNDYAAVLKHKPRRVLMQEVFPAILYLRVQRRRTSLLTAPLRQRQPRFMASIEGWHFDLAAIRQCGEVFQAEIDCDRRAFLSLSLRDLNLHIEVPAPTRILSKGCRLDLGSVRDRARIPKAVFATEDDDGAAIPVNAEGSGSIEWHPTERTLLPRPPCGTMPGSGTGIHKLASDGAQRVTVEGQLCACPGHQTNEIESAGPPRLPTLGLALGRTAVIPRKIHRSRHAAQMFRAGLVFHAISEGDNHAPATNWSEGGMQDIRTGRHVVYSIHAHLVFVTKYRRGVLSELAIRDLAAIFAKVCGNFGAELKECNGEDDHVHLLVVYPPKVALSNLVNSLKGVSSRLLREHRPEISGRYSKGVLWSPSYFAASCGGASLSVIAEYIKSQRAAADGRSRLPPRPKGRGFSRGDR